MGIIIAWTIFGLIIIFIIITSLVDDTNSRYYDKNTTSKDTIISEEPLEYQLASLNAGKLIANDDITIARLRALLERLSYTFVENRQKLQI